MRHVVSLVVVLCLAVGSISAATFVAPSDAELLGRARLVVVATVVDSVSREADGRMVYTDSRLRIEDVIKGSIASDIVTVSEAGGFANGHGVAISGSASYEPGTRVLAFLRQRDDGTYFTAYMALGQYRFVQRDGLELLVRDADEVEVDDQNALAPRPAREFVQYLRDGAPDTARTPLHLQNDAVPHLDPRTLAAPSAYVFIANDNTPLRWGCGTLPYPSSATPTDCAPSSTVPIDFKVNGVQTATAVLNTPAAIEAATQAWQNDPNSFVTFGSDGLGNKTDWTNDDVNDLVFDWDGANPLPQCDGALGCGLVFYNGTTANHLYDHVFRGTNFADIVSADVLIRHNASLTQTAFESILAHEVGHALGFRHSNSGAPSSTNALMNSVVPTSGAFLRSWDAEAVTEVYGNGLPCTPPSNLITSGAGTIFSGQTRTLSVSASGTAPLTYQWYRGSTGTTSDPVGTNSSQYTTPPLTETTSYWVKVSGCSPVQSANSSTITVTVDECPTPTITTQPQNQNIQSNHTATLTVAAQGGSPFTYQWYRGNTGNTSNPVGTNSTSFTTPQLTTNTNYWVRVTNTCGLVALSDTATVAIQECPKPAFTQQPSSNTNVPLNTTVTLTVATTSATTVTYQWFRGAAGDTTNPVGTNSTSFTTPPVISSQTYWVRATNTCGPTNSEAATVAPGAGCAPLSILIIPTVVNVPLGQGATINVAPGGTGPFTYQWYQGESPDASAPIAGATNSALALEPFEATGTFRYWIKVTDSCGTSINSTTVVVNVSCTTPLVPELSAPSISHYSAGYDVSWIANLVQTPSFELQEARDAAFTVGLKTFLVNGELHHHIDPHLDVTTDTRFFYRVRGISSCTQQPTPYSKTTTTVITAPQPSTSSEFSISVPQDATQTFTQPYLVPGFGESAHAGDTFAIVTDAPWLTVFPPSGALSAGGTTVQFTINPSLLDIGSSTGTVVVTRSQPSAARGVATEADKKFTLPFTVSKVT
ncbi:MAG TPA: matrixin family metalloprotease, partial [Thermoanaerobaculia bacterium]